MGLLSSTQKPFAIYDTALEKTYALTCKLDKARCLSPAVVKEILEHFQWLQEHRAGLVSRSALTASVLACFCRMKAVGNDAEDEIMHARRSVFAAVPGGVSTDLIYRILPHCDVSALDLLLQLRISEDSTTTRGTSTPCEPCDDDYAASCYLPQRMTLPPDCQLFVRALLFCRIDLLRYLALTRRIDLTSFREHYDPEACAAMLTRALWSPPRDCGHTTSSFARTHRGKSAKPEPQRVESPVDFKMDLLMLLVDLSVEVDWQGILHSAVLYGDLPMVRRLTETWIILPSAAEYAACVTAYESGNYESGKHGDSQMMLCALAESCSDALDNIRLAYVSQYGSSRRLDGDYALLGALKRGE